MTSQSIKRKQFPASTKEARVIRHHG